MTQEAATVELPAPTTPKFHVSSTKPARLERLRVFVARKIMLRHTYPQNFAIWLAPRSHPWTALAMSAREDFRNMTHLALRPRGPEGIEIAVRELEEVDDSSERIRRWLWRGAFVYLFLDFVSRHVPGPLSPLGADDTIRLFERIASSFPLGL